MNIVEKIQQTLNEYPADSNNQEELLRLQDFLHKMEEAGIARKRQYDIPLVDTLGRSLVV